MTAPTRIQRQRTKDWRMPDGAVYVGRPSRWGNPFRYRDRISGLVRTFPKRPGVIEFESRISAHGNRHDIFLPDDEGHTTVEVCNVRWATSAEVVEMFRRTLLEPDRGMLMGYPSAGGRYAKCAVNEIRAELAGHDLACWCDLSQPCHADVLLKIANGAPA